MADKKLTNDFLALNVVSSALHRRLINPGHPIQVAVVAIIAERALCAPIEEKSAANVRQTQDYSALSREQSEANIHSMSCAGIPRENAEVILQLIEKEYIDQALHDSPPSAKLNNTPAIVGVRRHPIEVH